MNNRGVIHMGSVARLLGSVIHLLWGVIHLLGSVFHLLILMRMIKILLLVDLRGSIRVLRRHVCHYLGTRPALLA